MKYLTILRCKKVRRGQARAIMTTKMRHGKSGRERNQERKRRKAKVNSERHGLHNMGTRHRRKKDTARRSTYPSDTKTQPYEPTTSRPSATDIPALESSWASIALLTHHYLSLYPLHRRFPQSGSPFSGVGLRGGAQEEFEAGVERAVELKPKKPKKNS
jgi:hypothetical protein